MDRKPLIGPAKEFLKIVVTGFRDNMEHSTVLPWDLSWFFIEDIEKAEKSPEGLKGDAVINSLVMAAQVDYSELMDYWEKLNMEEREEVVHRIIEGIAAYGLISLLGSIATYAEPIYKEDILWVAIDYYKGRISYSEMVSAIENILWPTQEDKLKYWDYARNFKKVMSLAKYLPERVVKAIVDVYFIKLIKLQMFDGVWAIPTFYPQFLE